MTAGEVYVFGAFTLDVAERRLTSHADNIALAPKAHDLLVALVRNAGRLQTKDELLQLVWPESFVDEGILSVHVSGLRKVLGDSHRASTYIETVPRTGYRLIAPVTATTTGGDTPATRWSLAVLPARLPEGGKADDRPAIGLAIADALIERLGRVPRIVVRSRAPHRGRSRPASCSAAAAPICSRRRTSRCSPHRMGCVNGG